MKTRIRKRMRLFLLEKEDIFQIKLFLLMANLSKLSLGSNVSWQIILRYHLKRIEIIVSQKRMFYRFRVNMEL